MEITNFDESTIPLSASGRRSIACGKPRLFMAASIRRAKFFHAARPSRAARRVRA